MARSLPGSPLSRGQCCPGSLQSPSPSPPRRGAIRPGPGRLPLGLRTDHPPLRPGRGGGGAIVPGPGDSPSSSRVCPPSRFRPRLLPLSLRRKGEGSGSRRRAPPPLLRTLAKEGRGEPAGASSGGGGLPPGLPASPPLSCRLPPDLGPEGGEGGGSPLGRGDVADSRPAGEGSDGRRSGGGKGVSPTLPGASPPRGC